MRIVNILEKSELRDAAGFLEQLKPKLLGCDTFHPLSWRTHHRKIPQLHIQGKGPPARMGERRHSYGQQEDLFLPGLQRQSAVQKRRFKRSEKDPVREK